MEQLKEHLKSLEAQKATSTLSSVLDTYEEVLINNSKGLKNLNAKTLRNHWKGLLGRLLARSSTLTDDTTLERWNALCDNCIKAKGIVKSKRQTAAKGSQAKNEKLKELEEEQKECTRGSDYTGGSSYKPVLSDSTADSKPVQRRSAPKYNYFVGSGIERFSLAENSEKWVIGDMDISNQFLEYRNSVVDIACKYYELSPCDELALSFIFLIDDIVPENHYIDRETFKRITESTRNEYFVPTLDDQKTLWCCKVSSAARRSNEEALNVLRQWQETGSTSEECQDTYRQMLKSYADGYTIDVLNEDTVVQDVFTPIFKAYFPNSSFIRTEGANGVIMASRKRKQSFEPDSEGRKADFSVHTKDGERSKALMLFECKPPKNSAAGKDLVKIARELKDCIDDAVLAGASEEFVVSGVIAEGARCRAFIMDLKYHGIYRMVEVARFYLPTDRFNFDVMLSVFEAMEYLKDVVNAAAVKCIQDMKKPSKDRTSMVLPTCSTPVQLPEDRVKSVIEKLNPDAVKRARRKLF